MDVIRKDPATGKPALKWMGNEARPAPGTVWTYSNTRLSTVQPSALQSLDAGALSALKIEKCSGGPTSCACEIPESPPFDGSAAPAPAAAPGGSPGTGAAGNRGARPGGAAPTGPRPNPAQGRR